MEVLLTIPHIEVERIRSRRGESMEAMLNRYKDNPNVEYAEPNIIGHVESTPDDPRFSELWGLHNTGQTGGTPDADIDAPEAWDQQTGSLNVIVAGIDSGVDYNHPDLSANMWSNNNEAIGDANGDGFPGIAGIDDDGDGLTDEDSEDREPGDPDYTNDLKDDDDENGYIDDIRGWNFFDSDNDPKDDNGHGTHTAGTVAAVGDNGIGVVGVSWYSTIMPLRITNASGGFNAGAAAEAITYAADMGAEVSNNSWGLTGFSQSVEDAIAHANSKGMLFVVAAGNDDNDNDLISTYPCTSTQPNVICVAATDHDDERAIFPIGASNYGATTVDLGAPGKDILSTVPTGS